MITYKIKAHEESTTLNILFLPFSQLF